MRARLTGLVLAFAFAATSALAGPPAQAPQQTQPVSPQTSNAASDAANADFQTRLQASLAWAAQFRGIVTDLVAPLQHLPDPPELTMNDAQRHTWADASRAWAANTRTTVQALRARLAQLPPPPPAVSSPTLQAAEARARDRLPEVLDSTLALADAQEQIAGAFEQHHDEALGRFRASAIDAVILTTTLFRETNRGQAEALAAPNPQHFLLDSFARSYDGFIAVMAFKRNVMLGNVVDREATAVTLTIAAQGMRADAGGGRAGVVSLRASVVTEAQTNAGTAAMLPRLQAVLDTYGPSFDREEAMAGELDAMAASLRDPRDFVAVEPQFDEHMTKFGDMDNQRMADVNHRAALYSQQP